MNDVNETNAVNGANDTNAAVKEHKIHKKSKVPQICLIVVLVILLFLLLLPIWFLLIKSVKTITQDQAEPFKLTFPFNWENYSFAWLYVKDLFLNTVILTGANIIGAMVICSATAYAFVRFRFPGKEIIFTAILALMMIPGTLTLAAQFVLVDDMGLVGTRWGVILPEIAGLIPFNLFLLRTFFAGLPNELFEAVEIDGGSDYHKFVHITLPLSMPILTTAAIMILMTGWNDLVWPRLVLDEKYYNIAAGLIPFTDWYYQMNNAYTAPMAGYVITSLPLIILFAFTSKQFVSGLTSGAIKM